MAIVILKLVLFKVFERIVKLVGVLFIIKIKLELFMIYFFKGYYYIICNILGIYLLYCYLKIEKVIFKIFLIF